MGPVRQHVNDLPEAPIELHIYPGQDGSFELYEDEGDQYNYEGCAFSTIDIQWQDAERRLAIGARKGGYAGMPEKQTFQICLHDAQTLRHEDFQAGWNHTVIYSGQPVVIKHSSFA
jgi:alpha-D-xyloside xylohydrolase